MSIRICLLSSPAPRSNLARPSVTFKAPFFRNAHFLFIIAGNAKGSRNPCVIQSSMEDWGADLSPCNFATTHSPAERGSEDAMGGWKKRGERKTSRMAPLPKKGGLDHPRKVRFPPPSGVSALFFFSVQKSTTEQNRGSFGAPGSKHFRKSAFSGTFSSPIRFAPLQEIFYFFLKRKARYSKLENQ